MSTAKKKPVNSRLAKVKPQLTARQISARKAAKTRKANKLRNDSNPNMEPVHLGLGLESAYAALPPGCYTAAVRRVMEKDGKMKIILGGVQAQQEVSGPAPTTFNLKDSMAAARERMVKVAAVPTEQNRDPNPKDAAGRAKLPLSLVPAVLTAETSLAYLEGKLKYGEVNWRETMVYASVYLDAAKRHLEKFAEGEDRDPMSCVHHLANATACFGIILDAAVYGTLIDDRKMSNRTAGDHMDDLSETVRHLMQLHGSKNPQHYTIQHGQTQDVGRSFGRQQYLGRND